MMKCAFSCSLIGWEVLSIPIDDTTDNENDVMRAIFWEVDT